MAVAHASQNIVIEYDSRENWLYANWRGPQSEDDIRSGGMRMIEAMTEARKQYGCISVLNDNRQVIGSWEHSADWAMNVWLPRMIVAGLQHFAWVIPPDAAADQAGGRLRQHAKLIDVMRSFEDIDRAREWLRSISRM